MSSSNPKTIALESFHFPPGLVVIWIEGAPGKQCREYYRVDNQRGPKKWRPLPTWVKAIEGYYLLSEEDFNELIAEP